MQAARDRQSERYRERERERDRGRKLHFSTSRWVCNAHKTYLSSCNVSLIANKCISRTRICVFCWRMLSAVAHWLVASLLHPLLPCMLFCIFVLSLVRFVWFLYFAVLLYRLSFTIHHMHTCRILLERKNIRAACLLPHKYLNSCESGRILLGCIIPLFMCVCVLVRKLQQQRPMRWRCFLDDMKMKLLASRIVSLIDDGDLKLRRVQSELGRYLGRSLGHIRPECSRKRWAKIDNNSGTVYT